jgi:phage repressor protein C with HTH and peptisase S24 domain
MGNEPLDWMSVGQQVDALGRGGRARLARALEMDRSQLARTLRRRGEYPTTVQAKKIDELLSGADPVEVGRVVPMSTAIRVPEYGYAASSGGDRIEMTEAGIIDLIELPMGMQLRGDYFVVRAPRSSMEPRIWAGERKLVQRNVPPGRDQDCVIEFHDGSAVLKTFRKERDGQVFAFQYNPEQELRFDAAAVKAIHAVFSL